MTVRPSPVSILILGAGWTSTFLIPLLDSRPISYAATTRDGRNDTIPFTFDPDSPPDRDLAPYKQLPDAALVLITFPLLGADAAALLMSKYERTRTPAKEPLPPAYVLLGSTSIWTAPRLTRPSDPPAYRDGELFARAEAQAAGRGGVDPKTLYPSDNARARAEDALLAARPAQAVVLCLAGLYDGEKRNPRDWAARVARSKEEVKGKKAVHLIHGRDVARGILGVAEAVFEGRERWVGLRGKRWILSDLRCYDWWDMLMSWDSVAKGKEIEGFGKPEYAKWVGELMVEEKVYVLPRDTKSLGRVLDATEFWARLGIWPSVGRVT